MKCPKCGLVHPNSEEICRRCQINMRTGEPCAKTTINLSEKKGSFIERTNLVSALKEKLVSRLIIFERKAKPSIKKTKVSEKGGGFLKTIVYIPEKLVAIFKRKQVMVFINCPECGEKMELKKELVYHKGYFIALGLTAMIIFIGGFKSYPLFFLAVITLCLIPFYLRLNRTEWKCPTCGFHIQRKS